MSRVDPCVSPLPPLPTMKVKLLLVAALVSFGVLCAWLLLSGGDREGRGEAVVGIAGPVADTAAAPGGPATLVDATATEAEPTIAAEADAVENKRAALATDEPLPTWPESETRWLSIQVVFPPRTPAAERVFVVALEDDVSTRVLYGPSGPFAALAEGREVRRVRNVLAGAEVLSDGTARLTLPPETKWVLLAVGGSFLFTPNPVFVELPAAVEPVQLRPTLGARISGRLLAPSREVVSGTRVALQWAPESNLRIGGARRAPLDRELTTGGDGGFDFRAVPVGHALLASTDKGPLARHFSPELTPEPGEHLQLDLALLSGATVRGRVVDEAGSPIEEAAVGALGREFLGNPTAELRSATSGADGLFELTGITPGATWLKVSREGYQEQLGKKFELADGQVLQLPDLVLTRGQALAGRVTFPDGAPAGGARIAVAPDMGENLAGSPMDPRSFAGAGNDAVADEGGAYRIDGLGPGPWSVTVELEQEVDAKRVGSELESKTWTAHRALVRAPNDELHLVLEASLHLIGAVVDGEGLPITAFTVRGELAGSQWYMPPSASKDQAFESADGRFLLDGLRSGKWTFFAEAEGRARSEEIELELPVEGEQRFVLLRSASLSGRVLDPNGEPAAGAEVSKELEGVEVFEAMQGRGDWPTETSDERGLFRLEGVAPGGVSIVAKKDGFAPSIAQNHTLAEGEQLADLVLTLRRGGTITGEVLDKTGKPAVECMVILQMPTLEERRFSKTDTQGRFAEAALKPGSWQVQAFPGLSSLTSEDGGAVDQMALMQALLMTTVELGDEAEEHVVLGTPPANPVRVRGRVSVGDEPIAGMVVSFLPDGTKGLDGLKIVDTKGDGTYEVELPEPGDYLVTAQAVGTAGEQTSVESRHSIPAAEEHRLDIALPLGRITGRVTGPDRQPISGARVSLSKQSGQVFGTIAGGNYSETRTAADGTYEILYLRPAEYTVAAGGAVAGGLFGSSQQALGRKVQTVQVAEGAAARIDFQLETPGKLAGIVQDRSGKPVSDAAIFVRDAQGWLLELISVQATGASGKFEYEGLAPGEYSVVARAGVQSSPVTERVTVRSGETTEVTIAVDAGTMLLVSLTDTTGADIRSSVSVRDERGHEVNGMLSITELVRRMAGGADPSVQRVGPLPPGTYQVRATAEDGRSTSRSVTLNGQEERSLKLRLK